LGGIAGNRDRYVGFNVGVLLFLIFPCGKIIMVKNAFLMCFFLEKTGFLVLVEISVENFGNFYFCF
jgi:hypothetical protein